MKLYLYVSIFCCALSYSSLNSFFIINNSDSPKEVEVIALLPQNDAKAGTISQTVLKKVIPAEGAIEAPFALREVVLDVHWGPKKLSPAQKTTWKPIENNSQAAETWQIIDTMRCGEHNTPCHAVLPPTWKLIKDHTGYTVTTDTGKIIHAPSKADLARQIPYRRLVDSFPQEKILATDAHEVQTQWKKIGMNHRKNEEIVIPSTWSIQEQRHESVITTDKGIIINIPIKKEWRIDPLTGKDLIFTIADEYRLKKAIPYRRKDGVITETTPKTRLFIIEEAAEKPLTSSMFNLFRRFTPREAELTQHAQKAPDVLNNDHIFEITGSEYDTDIAFIYAPDETSEQFRAKRKHSTESINEQAKKTLPIKEKKKAKQSLRKSHSLPRLNSEQN